MSDRSIHPDESQLISRSKQGDQRAYRSLYDLHVSGLYRFLLQFASSHADVEEWVQRAFVKAFEHLGDFEQRSSFATWLFRIALNEMRADIRRRKILVLEPEERAVTVAGADESERLPWSETIRVALDSLDDQKRSVFILYEVEGFSHREIGDMLEIEEGHSRMILTRTKALLRNQLHNERNAL